MIKPTGPKPTREEYEQGEEFVRREYPPNPTPNIHSIEAAYARGLAERREALLYVFDDLREGKYMHGASCKARQLEPCDCGLFALEKYINDALGGNVVDKSLRKSPVWITDG